MVAEAAQQLGGLATAGPTQAGRSPRLPPLLRSRMGIDRRWWHRTVAPKPSLLPANPRHKGLEMQQYPRAVSDMRIISR
jgi:hypothetical protein